MNKTSIEWVKNPDGSQGYTWNPITGCLNGCEYCYARKLANGRLRERYLANYNLPLDSNIKHIDYRVVNPFYPRFWPEKLDIKRKYGSIKVDCRNHAKPRGIFTCDMSDLFSIGIPMNWQYQVIQMIRACPDDRFYLLTKQPQNLAYWSPFPDNCWVGVSATDHYSFLQAQWYLGDIEAKIKYISFEPLLAQIPLDNLNCIDWIIIGALKNNPPKIEWVKEIVEAADRAGVPVFLKNNLLPVFQDEWGKEYAREIWEDETLRQEMPCDYRGKNLSHQKNTLRNSKC